MTSPRELIEVKTRGEIFHGLLAVGSLDTAIDHLYPTDSAVRILEATSDHTLLEFQNPPEAPAVGDRVQFGLTYPSLSHLMSSAYTRCQPLGDWDPVPAAGPRRNEPWRKSLDL